MPRKHILFPQNPSVAHSIPIMRSVNQEDGIEFTWAVWTYIKDLRPENLYKHVFHKGNNKIDGEVGMNFPNNAPGLYIAPHTNNFVVVMNTISGLQAFGYTGTVGILHYNNIYYYFINIIYKPPYPISGFWKNQRREKYRGSLSIIEFSFISKFGPASTNF